MEILNLLEDDYVVTGISDAQAGIKSGKYAGYVILPTTLSESVASVNTTHNAITFTYEISGELTDESKEEAIFKVSDFEQNFNDSISTMYVSSILKTFQTGQDNAQTVLGNDQVDLNGIMAIHSIDLIKMVKFSEVQRLEKNIGELSLDEQEATGEKLVQELDTTYKNFMLLSKSELEGLKNDYTSLDNQLLLLDNKINNVPSITSSDGSTTYSLSGTIGYLNGIKAGINQVITNHNTNITIAGTLYTNYLATLPTNKATVVQDIELLLLEQRIEQQLIEYALIQDVTMEVAARYFATTGVLDADITQFMTTLSIPMGTNTYPNPSNPSEMLSEPLTIDFVYYLKNKTSNTTRLNNYNNATTAITTAFNTIPDAIDVVIDPLTTKDDDDIAAVANEIVFADNNKVSKYVEQDLNTLNTAQKTAMNDLKTTYANHVNESSVHLTSF